MRNLVDDLGKVCTKCNTYKPFQDYHKHKLCRGGFNTVCKACRLAPSKAHYHAKPPEYHIWHRAKARAKKRGIPFNIELEDIVIPSKCPVFGTEFVKGNHHLCASIDKIVPELGYVKGNIQIISNRANMLKGDASAEELKKVWEWLETISCEI